MAKESTVQTADVETTVQVRFEKVTGQSAKSPVANYILYLSGPLAGLTLSGSIFKGETNGTFSVSLPGGRNYGGAFHTAERLETVNGRIIAVKGEYDPAGERKMARFDEVIKTAFYAWITDSTKNVQRVAF